MEQNDQAWRTFVDHVSTLQRRASLRRTRPADPLHNELDLFDDPRAYAQALSDIVDARHPAVQDFQAVGLIAQRKAENPYEPWRQREVDALWRAETSRKNLWDAVQRFTTEQNRVSPNVVLGADQFTRDWIDPLVEGAQSWEQYLSEQLGHAQDASVARDQSRSRSSSAVVSGRADDAAGSTGKKRAENENGQDPAAAEQSAEGSRSLSSGKKRSRERDDEHNGEHLSKRSSRPSGSPEVVIREEPRSSHDIPLDQLDPLEPELDPLKEFNSKWQALREQWDEKDRPTWERLYSRAHRLVEVHRGAMFPEDLSAATMADFRIKVNTALEDVLGWDWQEYIDIIKAAKEGLFQDGDLERAEMSREASMQRTRGGQSPVWPPRVRKEAPPPPGPPISFDVRTRAKTADAIDRDLIRRGGPQAPGEWQYLTTVGSGATGQAQLWTAVRTNDHGMIVERLVVKYFSIAGSWAKDSMWISNNYTGNENWLRERAMHAQLSSVGSRSGIVQYRGATSKAGQGDEEWIQRIYMEYCPHGDLIALLNAHAKTDGFGPQLDFYDEPIPQVRIPVQALWSVFKDLAAAACIMESGYNPLDNYRRAPDDWQEIIHRDIKPHNIFLAAPLAEHGRGIPVCKVGDFGLTVPRVYEPLSNPDGMWRSGSRGWKAPEYNPYAADSEHWHELTSATDIWAIGRIMLALMELPTRTPPPQVRYDDDNDGSVVVEARDRLVATYGEELYGLVEKCLQPEPDERIKAQNLLRTIDRQINNLSVTLPLELGDGDVLEHAQEMRWAT